MRKVVFVLFAAALLLGGQAAFAQSIPADLLNTARQFVEAVQKKDFRSLPSFMERPQDFSANGQLDRYTADYVYKRSANPAYRHLLSISELVEMGDIRFRASFPKSEDVVVFFVPGRFSSQMQVGRNFYANGYRKTYFGCQFSKTSRGWKMRDNFCYAETDGEPFPYPYR